MNPIEHVGRVAGRQPPTQNLQELERAFLEEWDRIPQLVINSLIDSMPQRELLRIVGIGGSELWRQPRPVTGCYAYKEEEAGIPVLLMGVLKN
ncbi:hypothetical protein TNCV_1980841 [Trichonephila clavipes]|nr:hypothetical protein TNCV_1980841 [Trichonephila clavipes]